MEKNMIYVALLRGINVGGNNKIEMKKLKASFEKLGFTNVLTYINSGNIIFEHIPDKQEHIRSEIEKIIKEDFQLDIKVLVRNFESISYICKALPDDWVKNEIMRTEVMFLWEKFDNPKITKNLKINSVDNVKYVSGALLWNVKVENYNKSGLPKLAGTEIYRNMTIRNVNTVRQLYKLMAEIDSI